MANGKPCGLGTLPHTAANREHRCIFHHQVKQARNEAHFKEEFTRKLKSELSDPKVESIDLTGYVFPDYDFSSIEFTKSVVFRETRFQGNVSFNQCKFLGSITDFSSAHFQGQKIAFSNAHFKGQRTSFAGADFEGKGIVYFNQCKFLSSTTDFSKACFHGRETDFLNAHFEGQTTDFTSARFEGKITKFAGAHFEGQETDFSRAEFHGARTLFFVTYFKGKKTTFAEVTFKAQETIFGIVEFQGEETNFSDAHFGGGVTSFSETSFKAKETTFIRANFEGPTNFSKAQFDGQGVNFSHAQFKGPITQFSDAHFGGERTDFSSAHFGGGRTDFSGVHFEGREVNFLYVDFQGEKTYFVKTHFEGAKTDFRFSNFEGQISFRHIDLSRIEFRGADLRKIGFLDVHWYTLPRKRFWIFPRRGRNALFDEVTVTANVGLPELRGGNGGQKNNAGIVERDKSEIELVRSAYRQLKQNYEDNRNYTEAGDFYYGEMEMTRLKLPFLRRYLLSWEALYWIVSGYGQRWGSSFGLLALTFLVFPIFFMFGGLQTPTENGLCGKYISYDIAWNLPPVSEALADYELCLRYSTVTILPMKESSAHFSPSIVTRYLLVAEIILLPTFATLFILALRRRFKR
jgi:uncharacterized protein YjbI with pentapeptide repeats